MNLVCSVSNKEMLTIINVIIYLNSLEIQGVRI